MKNIWRNVLIIASEQTASALVQHHQAGGVRGANAFVGVIDSSAGIQIEMVAMNQDRAVGSIMRPNARLGGKVEAPQDSRTGILAYLSEASLRLAFVLQAQHLSAITHQINPFPFDGHRR